jgi:putative permease
VTYLLFIGIFIIVLVFILPLVWRQLVALFTELPRMVIAVQQGLIGIQQRREI